MSVMNVTKRDGRVVPYDIYKIGAVIIKAFEASGEIAAIETDDSCRQHYLKLSGDQAWLAEVRGQDEVGYRACFGEVDLKDYLDMETWQATEKLEGWIRSFGYDSVDSIRQEYGTMWLQVIAEIIFESEDDYPSLMRESREDAEATVLALAARRLESQIRAVSGDVAIKVTTDVSGYGQNPVDVQTIRQEVVKALQRSGYTETAGVLRPVTDQQLQKLAKRIVLAGKAIAEDFVAKDFCLEGKYNGSIMVTSDSGFEAITIGDTTAEGKNGYMHLYRANTSTRNSFPNATRLTALLRGVLNRERLEEGEGKAGYYDWPEYGSMEKQLAYFSAIVRRMAKVNQE